MTSNVSQNYPYASEDETERVQRVQATLAAHEGLADKVKTESSPLGDDRRWWVWKCPTPACPGLLHCAGYARDSHAVYTVCDTCGRTYIR